MMMTSRRDHGSTDLQDEAEKARHSVDETFDEEWSGRRGLMILTWISMISALFAAGFWFWSATIKLPKEITSGFGGSGGSVQTLGDKLRFQSRLNAVAAFFAGLAALLQAIAQYAS
jgi:hypothetical protein